MNYRELNGKTIREGFKEFMENNPEVGKAFEEQTLRAIAKGRKKLSAKLLVNWIRWNKYIDSGEAFKINDAYQAYFARWFVAKYPEHKGVFNMRKLRNEEEAPYMNVEESGQITFY